MEDKGKNSSIVNPIKVSDVNNNHLVEFKIVKIKSSKKKQKSQDIPIFQIQCNFSLVEFAEKICFEINAPRALFGFYKIDCQTSSQIFKLEESEKEKEIWEYNEQLYNEYLDNYFGNFMQSMIYSSEIDTELDTEHSNKSKTGKRKTSSKKKKINEPKYREYPKNCIFEKQLQDLFSKMGDNIIFRPNKDLSEEYSIELIAIKPR